MAALLVALLILSPHSLPAGKRKPAPHVVVLVLDELPNTSLVDPRGRIDAHRYPRFAALAREATWYPNTAAVHADTGYAVPAIADGRRPVPDHLPVVRDHPQNIFTLLAGRYRLHVREEGTQLCPPAYCANRGPLRDGRRPSSPGRNIRLLTRAGRKAITKARGRRQLVLRHLDIARPHRFRQWMSGIRPGRVPELDFMHLMLPHVPWQYLPSGRTYNLPGGHDIRGFTGRRSFVSRWLVDSAWQRHLLQLGATDALLGELVDHLKRQGLWDQTLLVVTADHGVSFQRGHDRRFLRRWNVGELSHVPLFVKAPGQARGGVSREPRQSIDVLPTIADHLQLRIPWRVDGRSALRPAPRRRRYMINTEFHSYDVDAGVYRRQRRDVLRRKIAMFGWGDRRPGHYGIGPFRQLVGRSVSARRVRPSRRGRFRQRGARFLRSVSPNDGFVPTHVQGDVVGGRPGGRRAVAVAVNGRIVATGYTASLEGSRREYLSMLVPEDSLQPGRNRIEVFEVGRRGRLALLGVAI